MLGAVEPVQVPRKPKEDVRCVSRAGRGDSAEPTLDLSRPEERECSIERVLGAVDLPARQSPPEPVARSSRCGGLNP
jgi:hypothetical protein